MTKKKKDFGEHDKKTAARERKAEVEKEQKQRDARQKEDRFWEEAGEGLMTKAQMKRKEQDKQRNEALAKKQEAKELAKAEQDSMANAKKPKSKPGPVPKVTQRVLLQEKERQAAQLQSEIEQRRKVERKEVDEETYARLVEVENVNRVDGDVEARNVTDAIHALEKLHPIDDDTEAVEDMHPEKRRKAAFKKYMEREMVELKEDKPGLKLSQYKDIIFKRWLKSPENPMNQSLDA